MGLLLIAVAAVPPQHGWGKDVIYPPPYDPPDIGPRVIDPEALDIPELTSNQKSYLRSRYVELWNKVVIFLFLWSDYWN